MRHLVCVYMFVCVCARAGAFAYVFVCACVARRTGDGHEDVTLCSLGK